jgi:hypothetical protein
MYLDPEIPSLFPSLVSLFHSSVLLLFLSLPLSFLFFSESGYVCLCLSVYLSILSIMLPDPSENLRVGRRHNIFSSHKTSLCIS